MRATCCYLLAAGLLSAAASTAAAASGIVTGPPGAWVRPVPPASAPASAELAEGGVLLELVDLQVNLALSPPQYFTRVRLRVLNEAGLSEASLQAFDFDPSFESLAIHDVHIERSGGTIAAFDPGRVRVIRRETELERQVFDGSHTAVVTLDDVRVGDVVECSYSRTGVNPALARNPSIVMPMRYSRPAARLERRLLWPADRPAQVRLHHTDARPVVTPADGATEYRWSLRDVPALEFVPDLPEGYDVVPLAQVSGFPDWQSVARWGAAMYPSTGPVPPAVQAVADTIARRASSPEQRALLALQIVQDDVRYLADFLGEGAYRPRPTAEVLRRRFGDCKDKAALLVDLLRALGVRAAAALVSTRTGRQLDAFAPAPQVFDHVIACVTIDGRRHWLDPTRQGQRGAKLEQRSAADGGWALVLEPGTQALVRMDPTPESRAETHVWKHFDSPGYTDTVRLGVITEYRGADAERVRLWLRERNVARRTEDCLRFYRQHHEGIVKTRDVESFDAADSNLVRIIEAYAIPEFWTTNSASGRYTADVSPVELAAHLPPEPEPDRSAPLGLPWPSLARCETWVIGPEEVGLRTSDDVQGSAFLRVRVRETGEGRAAHLVHEIEALAPMVPAESLAAFAAFVEPIAGQLEFVLQSSVGRAGRPANAGANLPLLMFLAASLAAGVMLVLRGSRSEPPGWWSWRAAAFAADPAVAAAPVAEAEPADETAAADAGAGIADEPDAAEVAAAAEDGPREEPRDEPAAAPPAPPRIGGWLVLPAIGLVVTPFRVAYEARVLLPFLDQSVWNATVEAAGPGRFFVQASLLLSMCGNVLLIALAVWAILELFRRRRIFPLAYIVTMGAGVALVLLDLMLATMADPASSPDPGELGAIGRGLTAFAFWSAYMLRSKRVRRTFVR